jgi:D-alanyl-D-alanine carboxypeptidase/D-alanyl-D-alanine-endopeptidase (penicillin-binding protein 4)
MRRFAALIAWVIALIVAVPGGALAASTSAPAAASDQSTQPEVALKRALEDELSDPAVGSAAGVYVLDLTERRPLFKWEWEMPRIPASNTKLFTSSATIDRYGTEAVLTTSVLGVGSADANGVFPGDLYLRGGGDPTFGTAAFIGDRYEGTGASIEELADEVEAAGITAVRGRILGDESRFDSVRQPAGGLSALAFDRGPSGASANPPLVSAQRLTSELAGRGIVVDGGAGTGITPAGATTLAAVASPTVGRLVRLTNKPSDNFFAEMLLKNLSAADGDQGTTLDGTQEAEAFARSMVPPGWAPEVDMADGSGLSRQNRMSARAIVALLDRLRSHSQFPVFFDSLPIAGVDGTLETRMDDTAAEGNCSAKTGTLSGVSALSGYCQVAGGHLVVFSILMNEVQGGNAPPRAAQDRMTAAIASYSAAAADRAGVAVG